MEDKNEGLGTSYFTSLSHPGKERPFVLRKESKKKKQDMNPFFTPCTHFLQITIVMSS
jgi:hypothetical protein